MGKKGEREKTDLIMLSFSCHVSDRNITIFKFKLSLCRCKYYMIVFDCLSFRHLAASSETGRESKREQK